MCVNFDFVYKHRQEVPADYIQILQRSPKENKLQISWSIHYFRIFNEKSKPQYVCCGLGADWSCISFSINQNSARLGYLSIYIHLHCFYYVRMHVYCIYLNHKVEHKVFQPGSSIALPTTIFGICEAQPLLAIIIAFVFFALIRVRRHNYFQKLKCMHANLDANIVLLNRFINLKIQI